MTMTRIYIIYICKYYNRMSKFLFYGCWNNINCEKEYVYRDLVLSYIKKKEKALSTFYIAGDNWYSTKILTTNILSEDGATKKDITTQYYLLSILKTGYYKIYSLNKTIHVAAGNHDEEIDDEDLKLKPTKERCMIKTQKKYIDTLNEIGTKEGRDMEEDVEEDVEDMQDSEMTSSQIIGSDFNGFQPTLEELAKIQKIDIHKNTINLYVDNIGIVYNEKYIVIIINTNKLNDDNYMEDIKSKFREISEEECKQIFVMGHVPLFAIKVNKIKEKKEKKADPLFGKRDKLFELLAEYKYIYMCADSHYFSIMEISKGGKTVIQITSGTGGADPDINTEYYKEPENKKYEQEQEHKQEHKQEQEQYDIKYYLLNSYGYSIIRIYKHKIIIIYKKIIDANEVSNKDGNAYFYSIQRNDGTIKFEKISSIIKVFSDEKFEVYRNDKVLTCGLIKNQLANIKDNVVTSDDKVTFCYKKIKD